jgi:hypothetical protein
MSPRVFCRYGPERAAPEICLRHPACAGSTACSNTTLVSVRNLDKKILQADHEKPLHHGIYMNQRDF